MAMAAGPGGNRPWSLRVLAALATIPLFYLGTPKFPWGTNLYHVPIVLNYAASAEGPHDAFHQSLAKFISYFWLLVRFAATESNLEFVFIALAYIGFASTVWALLLVARSAGAPERLPLIIAIALVAGMALFNSGSPLGNSELLVRVASHSQIATALCLLAVALACCERWLCAAVVIGLTGNVNLFLAFWTGTALYGTLLFIALLSGWQRNIRTLAGFPILAGILTLPTLVWIASVEGGDVADFSYAQFLRDYYPHHFFAHLRPAAAIEFFGTTVLTLLLLSRGMPEVFGRSTLVRFTAIGIAILFATQPVFYLFDYRLLLNLHPLRFVGTLMLCETALLVAAWVRLQAAGDPRCASLFIALIGVGLPGGALKLLGLALFAVQSKLPRRWGAAALVGVAIATLLTVVWPESTSWTEPTRLPILALSLVVLSLSELISNSRWKLATMIAAATISVAPVVAAGAARKLTLVDFAWVASVGAAIALVFVLGPVTARSLSLRAIHIGAASVVLILATGTALMCQAGLGSAPDTKLDDFKAAQIWARASTPPGTLFQSLHANGFATLSRRPVWFDHTQGAAVMWDPAFYQEWEQRRRLIRNAKTPEELAALARSEGISYLVVESRQAVALEALGLKPVYRNRTFTILGEIRASPTELSDTSASQPRETTVPFK